MVAMSRFIAKDCSFQSWVARYDSWGPRCLAGRPLPCLDLRRDIICFGDGRRLTIERKSLKPAVSFAAAPRFSPVSRELQISCKAATNASGDLPARPPDGMSQYERIVETLTTLFPVWVILGTVLGIYKPAAVTWLETDLFTVGLGFLMLSMGLTLTFEDFRRCLRNPWTFSFALEGWCRIPGPILDQAHVRLCHCHGTSS